VFVYYQYFFQQFNGHKTENNDKSHEKEKKPLPFDNTIPHNPPVPMAPMQGVGRHCKKITNKSPTDQNDNSEDKGKFFIFYVYIHNKYSK